MRVLLFVISLFSYLLTGGYPVLASSQTLTYEQQQHLTTPSSQLDNLDSLITFFEDTDVDSADESNLNNDNSNYSFEKTSAIPHFVHIPWLKAPPAQWMCAQTSIRYTVVPPSSGTSPIYLKHRNLRI